MVGFAILAGYITTKGTTFGGLSGLAWHDGTLVGVQDDGVWVAITPEEQADRLVGLESIANGALLNTEGEPLSGKARGDAESITRDADGNWLVGFEQDHRIWRYAALDGPAEPSGFDPAALTGSTPNNSGLETLETLPNGLLLCAEFEPEARANCGIQTAVGLETFALSAPPPIDQHSGVPTDASCDAAGTCYILFRSYSSERGNTGAIVQRQPDGTTEPLAIFEAPITLDNYEALAMRQAGGRTFLYLASDDNFASGQTPFGRNNQRTLLLKFEVLP